MDLEKDFITSFRKVKVEGGNIIPFYAEQKLNQFFGKDKDQIDQFIDKFFSYIEKTCQSEAFKAVESNLMGVFSLIDLEIDKLKNLRIRTLEKNGNYLAIGLSAVENPDKEVKLEVYPCFKEFDYSRTNDGSRKSEFILVVEFGIETTKVMSLLQIEKKKTGFDIRFGLSKKELEGIGLATKLAIKAGIHHVTNSLVKLFKRIAEISVEENS